MGMGVFYWNKHSLLFFQGVTEEVRRSRKESSRMVTDESLNCESIAQFLYVSERVCISDSLQKALRTELAHREKYRLNMIKQKTKAALIIQLGWRR